MYHVPASASCATLAVSISQVLQWLRCVMRRICCDRFETKVYGVVTAALEAEMNPGTVKASAQLRSRWYYKCHVVGCVCIRVQITTAHVSLK